MQSRTPTEHWKSEQQAPHERTQFGQQQSVAVQAVRCSVGTIVAWTGIFLTRSYIHRCVIVPSDGQLLWQY